MIASHAGILTKIGYPSPAAGEGSRSTTIPVESRTNRTSNNENDHGDGARNEPQHRVRTRVLNRRRALDVDLARVVRGNPEARVAPLAAHPLASEPPGRAGFEAAGPSRS